MVRNDVMKVSKMSGLDERENIGWYGTEGIPAKMLGKVTLVLNKFLPDSICDHPDCNEKSEYLIGKGPKARRRNLRGVCCKKHLLRIITKVFEEE